jgi:hypothetical protein
MTGVSLLNQPLRVELAAEAKKAADAVAVNPVGCLGQRCLWRPPIASLYSLGGPAAMHAVVGRRWCRPQPRWCSRG